MIAELSHLNSFLGLVVVELNRRNLDTERRWYINHIMLGTEVRAEITFGNAKNNLEVVSSMSSARLIGNTMTPRYEDLIAVFADGIVMAAEKKRLI
jgi:hypothetical protein